MATVTLSALGLGLVFAQSTSHTLARGLLSVGLAGADYYFWLALWVLSRYISPHRTFGWGLGFSLVQIAIATLFDMLGLLQGYDRQTLFFVALGVTMILLPVIFSSRFQVETNSPPEISSLEAAANLTEAESKIFMLLARGKSDQEIAGELYISRHTVKFHVRNILHKFNVPNRKVLLSRLSIVKGDPTRSH
ncbi:MAG: helix-turn-helix transcriptional regulator [Bacillota bacterium]|nr:helix-turn-helix transcriptional regulator [Bacillota bacterium]